MQLVQVIKAVRFLPVRGFNVYPLCSLLARRGWTKRCFWTFAKARLERIDPKFYFHVKEGRSFLGVLQNSRKFSWRFVWDRVFQKDPAKISAAWLDSACSPIHYTFECGDHTMEAERNTEAGMHISDLFNIWGPWCADGCTNSASACTATTCNWRPECVPINVLCSKLSM